MKRLVFEQRSSSSPWLTALVLLVFTEGKVVKSRSVRNGRADGVAW
jgi:hypothetical protein